jgi:hypothetical protein
MLAKQWMTLVVAVLAMGPFFGAGVGAVATSPSVSSVFHAPLTHATFAPSGTGTFEFVSNFEDHVLDGWHQTVGTASVVTSPNYNGEPALSSTPSTAGVQVDHATQNFITGLPALSFESDLYYAGNGTGFVGLYGPSGPVAVVGVSGGATVWAGPSPSHLTRIEAIPTGTAQPAGWVSLMAIVQGFATSSGTAWSMLVYVDRTDVVAGNVSVPLASGYLGGLIETTHGTMDYTNGIFSTYQIPITIPGYNNMDGYGQGSGLLVSLLPKYTTLSSEMVLSNWTIPQDGILSFQINAMNRAGTTLSTCQGFYQLGLDLDAHGHIAPWFVPDDNCVAHYFDSNNTPSSNPGFLTPPGSKILLTITDNTSASTIFFQVQDLSVSGANRTLNATISYNGGAFFGAYTQVEWQPCCSSHPISSYFLNGTLQNLRITGGNLTSPMDLPASYMLPFALDVPPSWNFNYYQSGSAGYNQVA